jgi:hypothetical protein
LPLPIFLPLLIVADASIDVHSLFRPCATSYQHQKVWHQEDVLLAPFTFLLFSPPFLQPGVPLLSQVLAFRLVILDSQLS